MNKKATGSYVTIKPLDHDGLWRGVVQVENGYRGLYIDDIVFYHEDDLKEIKISGERFHIVLYYHIVYKEDKVISPAILNGKPDFNFKGITTL